jgi:hypothetical protein
VGHSGRTLVWRTNQKCQVQDSGCCNSTGAFASWWRYGLCGGYTGILLRHCPLSCNPMNATGILTAVCTYLASMAELLTQ